ncbi:MAG: glycosyltransferase family 39 protein, partial [Tepidisphaeraceae bacterium]
MFVWIRVFGDSEISVRLPPLICGLATIVLTARLARDYGFPSAGIVTAFVLAASPAHIWYSQEARPYSLLMLLVVLLALTFHRVRKTGAPRWLTLFTLLAPCAVMTHYYAMAYIGMFALLSLPDRRIRARMIGAAALSVVVLVLFVALKSALGSLATQAPYLHGFGITELWRLLFEWFIIGGTLGDPAARAIAVQLAILAAQLLFAALAIRGLLVADAPGLAGSRRLDFSRRLELATLLLVLPAALLILGLLGRDKFYIERSALPALPFFAIAIGVGAASLRRPAWRGLSGAVIGALAAVVVVNYLAKLDQRTIYKPNADWRSAAPWLRAERERAGRPL